MSFPLSFEFFPPRTDKGRDSLIQVIKEFKTLEPEYMSVTFGAGGSTQEGTLDTVLEIKNQGVDPAPHLSCIGAEKTGIEKLLEIYQGHNISRIVALRGDLPSGARDIGEFNYANELVEFIRKETGDYFHIEVAAYPEKHPQAKDFYTDFANFKRKVDVGANAAITQYFYSVDAYYRFVDECTKQNVKIPVVPGIMPISNYVQLARFSNMCGAEIPKWLSTRLEAFGDDLESIKKLGLDVVTKLCEDLLNIGAPGLHFYSMNKNEPCLQIIRNLKS